ncbi:MAG TPA: hypothetical protein VM118_10730, partial [Acidobacteriota bacterium]|nr:hypothetical protein [Acidobacteriota bacterium]
AVSESKDEAHTPVSSQEVSAIRDFCAAWVRAVKTICLYPEANPLPDELRGKFYEALSRILEDQDQFDLTTFDGSFCYEGETVFDSSHGEDNLSCAFFRDGIRRISFERGITRTEADEFLDLLARATSAGTAHEDIANLLWQAGFNHIRHFTVDRVIEGAYIDPAEDATLESVHQRFVGSGFIAGDEGGDADAFGEGEEGERAEDEGPYTGIQNERFKYIVNVFGDVRQLTNAEKQAVASLVQLPRDEEMEQLGVEILFEIARGADNPRVADDAVRVMEKQYGDFVEADRWDLAELLLKEWRDSLGSAPARIAERLQSTLSRAANAQTFDRLAAYLNANPRGDLSRVRRLLGFYGPAAITPITAMLGTLKHRPARMVVCEFLAEYGRETIDLIGAFIYDKRWYVVRNVAMVLGEIGHARALVFLQKSATHADHRVRLETLRSAQRYRGLEAERIIQGFLDDGEADLRRRALRALGQMEAKRSLPHLEQMIALSALPERDPQELRELFSTYGLLGGEKAVSELARIANRTHWFGAARWRPVRVAAVFGLGASPQSRARAELGILARKKISTVTEAARHVLEHRNRDEVALEDDWRQPDLEDDT